MKRPLNSQERKWSLCWKSQLRREEEEDCSEGYAFGPEDDGGDVKEFMDNLEYSEILAGITSAPD
jgi:hypothetical protein